MSDRETTISRPIGTKGKEARKDAPPLSKELLIAPVSVEPPRPAVPDPEEEEEVDALFVGVHGFVVAIDLSTVDLRERWRTNLSQTGYRTVTTLHWQRRLFVHAWGNVFCLDPRNGAIAWRCQPAGFARCPDASVVNNSRFLFVGGSGHVACLEPSTGRLLWSSSLPQTLWWCVNLLVSPVDESVVFAGTFGSVFAIQVADGRPAWKYSMSGQGPVSLAVAPDCRLLYVGYQGTVHSVDCKTGEKIGSTDLRGSGYYPVAMKLANGVLYCASWGIAYALQAQVKPVIGTKDTVQETLWANSLEGCGWCGGLSLVLHGKLGQPPSRLVIGINGRVAAVSCSGSLLWVCPLPRSGFRHVNLLFDRSGGGRLIAASAGHLYGIDPLTGSILWVNDLPGLGIDFVTVCTANASLDLSAATMLADSEMRRKAR